MESDTMMIDEPMCCLGCGEPYSATGWVDVIDLETMTAGVVCHESCVFEDEGMIQIPAYAFDIDGEPDIPEWAYNDYVPQPVSVDVAVPVVQVRAPWDAVTDVLAYEEVDDEVGVDA